MAMPTAEGEPPTGYVPRRIYQSDMVNPHNGSYAKRKIISDGNNILYGKSQLELQENMRAGKAEIDDLTDPTQR